MVAHDQEGSSGALTDQVPVTSLAALTLSSCTPKPHSRATCLSTSCALSANGLSLCWKWRSVMDRSPRRLTFHTWMFGSREPRSYCRDSASRTRR